MKRYYMETRRDPINGVLFNAHCVESADGGWVHFSDVQAERERIAGVLSTCRARLVADLSRIYGYTNSEGFKMAVAHDVNIQDIDAELQRLKT